MSILSLGGKTDGTEDWCHCSVLDKTTKQIRVSVCFQNNDTNKRMFPKVWETALT